MIYRRLTSEETLALNPQLAARGFSQLNDETSFVLGAFDDQVLVEILALQLYPILGPLLKLREDYCDNGEISRRLTQDMDQFLRENNARGYIVIADSPLTVRLCERYNMRRVDSPVFMQVAGSQASS